LQQIKAQTNSIPSAHRLPQVTLNQGNISSPQALDDLRSEDSILLIEWGEKFARFVRERDVEISLEREGENGRRIKIDV
jgi:tRNA A37 threonylcarbamoyladenosine biosynthesis protein TsaE